MVLVSNTGPYFTVPHPKTSHAELTHIMNNQWQG